MQSSQYTPSAKKGVFDTSERSISLSLNRVESSHLKSLIHRRAEEIHTRIRLIHARLTSNKERLVFQYIVNNTIGHGKSTDQIANSQFKTGKRCTKTGRVIDFGCGLKSIKAIRQARKSLVEQEIIFEEPVTDVSGARLANQYGLVFLRDLLELHQSKKRVETLEQYTPTRYYETPPTIESPKEINKQRCTTQRKNKKRRSKTQPFMDSAHVDYLIDLIEQVTGDTKSRGAFAQIALTVPEGRIMELLSILKDRDNIQNKGAWLYAVAQKYQARRVVRADDPEPPVSRAEREQSIPAVRSYRDLFLAQKPELANLMDMNNKLQIPATHHKVIEGV